MTWDEAVWSDIRCGYARLEDVKQRIATAFSKESCICC